MLYPGLYEQVINNALNRELAEIPEARKSTAPIDTAEAAKVLAQYLTMWCRRVLRTYRITAAASRRRSSWQTRS